MVEISPDFRFIPTTDLRPIHTPGPRRRRRSPPAELGDLGGLVGTWAGTGFNTIWRPFQPGLGSDRFLELNVTAETLQFDLISGTIPNRGLLQGDLFMAGVHYLQQISDANVKDPLSQQDSGLHLEPGVWLSVPSTSNPLEPASVARLARSPMERRSLLQGAMLTTSGPPTIGPVSITPFVIGNPAKTITFPEQTLTDAAPFRTQGPGLTGVVQTMLDNPNSVLTRAAPPPSRPRRPLRLHRPYDPAAGGRDS